ncbi:hypothetical protein BDQ94DRAFT_144311 [Aspergillus welwitschiae]|uniref:Uncharacterized protein n=1 Tax=Aspergillus welwitschiae TaxID=1341132 RepID=A0A3F3Q1J0_9EURO|nr:hypothetical protein BDQ94DRAFT_144311 [Aspergillus welwitschiae]RDH33020.1 hypothetical protein BDQ94DRAFT_144311 [Aspergillus welwitschiae]
MDVPRAKPATASTDHSGSLSTAWVLAIGESALFHPVENLNSECTISHGARF